MRKLKPFWKNDLSLQLIIETINNWSVDNLNKHVNSMKWSPDLMIQSCDTGQQIPYFDSC